MPYDDCDDAADVPLTVQKEPPPRRTPHYPALKAPTSACGARRVRRRHPARDQDVGLAYPSELGVLVAPLHKPTAEPPAESVGTRLFPAAEGHVVSTASPPVQLTPQAPLPHSHHGRRRHSLARTLRVAVLVVLVVVGLAWAYTQAPKLLVYTARHSQHSGMVLLAVLALTVVGGLNQALSIKLVGRMPTTHHD